MRALGAFLLLAPFCGTAAAQVHMDEVYGPASSGHCEIGPDGRQSASIDPLVDAVLDRHSIDLTVGLLRLDSPLTRLVQAAVGEDNPDRPGGANQPPAPGIEISDDWRDAARNWYRDLRHNLTHPSERFALYSVDGSALPTGEDEIYRTVLGILDVRSPAEIRVRCFEHSATGRDAAASRGGSPGNAAAPDGGETGRPADPGAAPADNTNDSADADPVISLNVARTRGGLLRALPLRDFARLAWTGDRAGGDDDYEFQIVVGTGKIPLLSRAPSREHDWSFSHRAFVDYRRSTSSTANSTDINQLSFGLVGSWYYAQPVTGVQDSRFQSSVEFITDDQLDSEIYRASLQTTLPFDRLAPGFDYLAYGSPTCGVEGDNWCHQFTWRVDAVTDWYHVSDAGGNAKLSNAAQYFRIGLDLRGEYRVSEGGDSGALWRAYTAYQLREGLNIDGGAAQLFTAGLAFEPSKSGNVELSLEYQRGEELISLTEIEKWTFSVGFRY